MAVLKAVMGGGPAVLGTGWQHRWQPHRSTARPGLPPCPLPQGTGLPQALGATKAGDPTKARAARCKEPQWGLSGAPGETLPR